VNYEVNISLYILLKYLKVCMKVRAMGIYGTNTRKELMADIGLKPGCSENNV
jgi:hypothetical protein